MVQDATGRLGLLARRLILALLAVVAGACRSGPVTGVSAPDGSGAQAEAVSEEQTVASSAATAVPDSVPAEGGGSRAQAEAADGEVAASLPVTTVVPTSEPAAGTVADDAEAERGSTGDGSSDSVAVFDDLSAGPDVSGADVGDIVFVSDGGGDTALFAMAADGSGQRKLADVGVWPFVLSPQGSRIAFVGSAAGSGEGLFVTDADGGGPRRLAYMRGHTAPLWSPDGNWLAYSDLADEFGMVFGWRYPWEASYHAFVVGADGESDARQITSDAFWPLVGRGLAAWSPDSALLAFSSYHPSGMKKIFVADIAGAGGRQLVAGEDGEQWAPAWSLNGTKIAYYSRSGEATSLWVAGADGSGARELSAGHRGTELPPVWSPDGSRLAFYDEADGALTVSVVGTDGSGVRVLAEGIAMLDYLAAAPVWSPDARRIAFSDRRDGDSEIFVVDADGANLRQLTDNDTDDYALAWHSGAAPSMRAGQGDVPQPAPADGAVAVTVSFGHQCVLWADRSVECTDDEGNRLPAASGSFVSVSAGYAHSCGVRTDGTLTCWGDNEFGQLDAPTGSFVSVSASGDHACAVRTERTVACWGEGDAELAALPGSFDAVSAGSPYACGIRTDRSVSCWMLYEDDEAWASDQILNEPEGLFAAVSVLGDRACGVRSDHMLVCWGDLQRDPAPGVPSTSAGSEFIREYGYCGVRQRGPSTCLGKLLERLVAPFTSWGVPLFFEPQFGTEEPYRYEGSVPGLVNSYASADFSPRRICGVRSTDAKLECWTYND